jgi:hypothetical protein
LISNLSDESTASILKAEQVEIGEKGFPENGSSRFRRNNSKYLAHCTVSHPENNSPQNVSLLLDRKPSRIESCGTKLEFGGADFASDSS